jgi:aspartate racemase
VYPVDFQEIEALQFAGDWESLRNIMHEAGVSLRSAGADFVVLCTNTMHKVMDKFESDVGVPFLNITTR